MLFSTGNTALMSLFLGLFNLQFSVNVRARSLKAFSVSKVGVTETGWIC